MKDIGKTCMGGMCAPCHGLKMLLFGAVLAANVWWTFVADPWLLVGLLFVVGGLWKMVMPSCSHCG